MTWFTTSLAHAAVPGDQKRAAVGKEQAGRQFLQVLVASDEGGFAAFRADRLVQKPEAFTQRNYGLVTV